MENPLLKAVSLITQWLERRQVPLLLFEGSANSLYGNPRQTFDIPIKIEAWKHGK
jgi:hypothetical protein